jgi:hypothetical protein
LSGIEWWYSFKIQIEDWDNFKNIKGPVVIVCNHQSSIDSHIMLKSVPNGTAVVDNCGTCDSDTTNNCVQDYQLLQFHLVHLHNLNK